MIVGISGKKQSGKNTVAKIWQLLESWHNNFEGEAYYWVKHKSIKTDIEYSLSKANNYCSWWEQKPFAEKLKHITCTLFLCSMEDLEKEEFKNSYLPDGLSCYKVYTDTIDNDGRLIRTIYKAEEAEKAKKNYIKVGYKNAFIDQERLTYREFLQLLGTDMMRSMVHPDIWVITRFLDYQQDSHWLIPDVRFPNEAKAILEKGGFIIRIEKEALSKDNHPSEIALDGHKNLFKYTINNNGSLEELAKQVKDIMIAENIINK